MPNKRHGDKRPQRLTDFYSPVSNGDRQDGAMACSPPATTSLMRTLQKGIKQAKNTSQNSHHSYPPFPSTNSPAKSKPRMDGNGLSPEGSVASDSGEDTREIPESIETYPTQNQPVLDTVLKDMLLSLRSTIQSDMASYMHKINKDIQSVGNRIDHIETKMEEYAGTINDLVDANDEREGDTEWIKAKLADMEDRSWRNNLKIKRIPETVHQNDLHSYAANMLKQILPGLMDLDVTIDRIHRIPKSPHLSEHIPRDVLLRLHFFHVKENLMVAMRKKEQLPPQ